MQRVSVKARLYNRRVASAGMLAVLLFSGGCSHVRFNAQMCDPAEPGQTIPRECYSYSEEEAAKASMPEKEECAECSQPKKLEYKR